MEILRDIAKVSNYRPDSGLKRELFFLVNDQKLSRKEAEREFERRGKKGQFAVVYKRLKDSLLEGIQDSSLKKFSPKLQIRFKIWKKHLQTRILLHSRRLTAGVALAKETLVLAERNHMFDVSISLCSFLTRHYSTIEPNTSFFKKYQSKLQEYHSYFEDEYYAENLYHELVLLYYKNKNIAQLEDKFEILESKFKINKHQKFRFYYFSIFSILYHIKNDYEKLIDNNLAALRFFEKSKDDLPYVVKFSLQSDLIPPYLVKDNFADAEIILRKCLRLPPTGSFNHHKILIYQAMLGFYSKKPKIALHAYLTSEKTPKKFDSEVIDLEWHLLKGYLALYDKLNLLRFDEPWRLSKFLNITEKQGDHDTKANLLIIELLHLLVDKKHPAYFEKVERIEAHINRHFKAREYKRTRYFLRMLKCVVKGNFHSKLTSAHAVRYVKSMAKARPERTTKVIEREFVPYETLWNLVLSQLR